MNYYVRLGDNPPLSVSKLEVYQMIQAGRVTRDTPACQVGASEWIPAGRLLPDFFVPGAPPPPDDSNAVAEMVGKAGHFIAEHGGEVAGLAQLFTRRILASNF